jgi:hypothetical protein
MISSTPASSSFIGSGFSLLRDPFGDSAHEGRSIEITLEI